MKLAKEMLDTVTLAAFDLINFDESHRMDEGEWKQVLGSGYVAIYTARDEQNDIVAILALKTSSVDTGCWYLFSVAVAAKYRKMKLASRLFNKAIMDEISVGVISSHCHIDNVASIGFHKSLGFTSVQYVNDFYGDFKDAIMWARSR